MCNVECKSKGMHALTWILTRRAQSAFNFHLLVSLRLPFPPTCLFWLDTVPNPDHIISVNVPDKGKFGLLGNTVHSASG